MIINKYVCTLGPKNELHVTLPIDAVVRDFWNQSGTVFCYATTNGAKSTHDVKFIAARSGDTVPNATPMAGSFKLTNIFHVFGPV